ncbi:MAG: hypothetical protein M1600_11870 [Firmicutes bacterium]|jgi:hypothetical protein|nr:hypothetical protein [Bacillota bacterium]
MPTLIHTDWKYHDIEAATLENAYVRLDVLTGLGAKIYNLWDRVTGKNLLWHHPHTLPVRPPFGANFDDWWAGGWDDPFPNGAPVSFKGEMRPYLGELWTQPWHAVTESKDGRAALHVWADGIITPARVDKWLVLDPERPILRIFYKVTNRGYGPIEFMLGIHPALAIGPGYRLDLPACQVLVEESSAGAFGTPGCTYAWPWINRTGEDRIDLRAVPDVSHNTYGFAYAHTLAEGWTALSGSSTQPGLAMAFDVTAFPVVWLWMVYGGWRGLYHVAMEPWTSFPTAIDEASRGGRTVVLNPGDKWETAVTAVVHHGWKAITHVSPHGEISGERGTSQ